MLRLVFRVCDGASMIWNCDFLRPPLAVLAACVGLGGCSATTAAPAIPLFGAYFPSWLACALAGIVGAVLVRLVFIRVGIDDALSFRLPIYACLAAGIGFLVSSVGFGR